MTHRVRTTRRAEYDFEVCYRYIAERSPSGAASWARAFDSAIQLLASNPPLGLAPESVDHEEEIRQLVFKTKHGLRYRLLLAVQRETIWVLHVRGPGQDLIRPGEIESPPDQPDSQSESESD